AAIGDALLPTPIIISDLVATCGNQGGTSLAIVPGRKLAGVDSVTYPVLLAITCLDNANVDIRSRVNFIDPLLGTVIKSIQTMIPGVGAAPAKGGAPLVHRPERGAILGCGPTGPLYSIGYDGTATPVSRPSGLSNSCGGLAWDPADDMIYQGLTVGA